MASASASSVRLYLSSEDGPQLRQLDKVAGIDPAAPPATPAPIAQDGEDVRLAAHVAPLADLVLPQEMADSWATTPASCASLRIRSSRPEKTTEKPVGNITALKSGMRAT